MKLPTLFAKSKSGDMKQWSIEVTTEKGKPCITVYSGRVGGKIAVRKSYVLEGKNTGKSNATTPLEQAKLEAMANWTAKKERKEYTEERDAAESHESIRPMLANKYQEKKHCIKWPAYVQPKLDGMRMMVRLEGKKLIMESRQGKDLYPVLSANKKLIEALQSYANIKATLDGELYHHGWSLQRITAAAKKIRDDTQLLEYHIFDFACDQAFGERFGKTKGCKCSHIGSLYLVETWEVENESEMLIRHAEFVKEGYEGTIIRNAAGLYEFGHRSNDLLKYKQFLETDYKIVGIETEVQTINGTRFECIMFKCEVSDGGETFTVRPRGSLDFRQELMDVSESFLGKMLTVRYQNLSEVRGSGKQLPIFPVGIMDSIVRDYE